MGASIREGSTSQQDKWDTKISALGPLKDNERKDLNCAVKEYLLLAGYRLAAMTFIEEVYSTFTLPVATSFNVLACDFFFLNFHGR